MERPLAGRVILIIEDEPLALNISDAFQDEGAKTITARTLAAALVAVEDPALSAAIVDHALVTATAPSFASA